MYGGGLALCHSQPRTSRSRPAAPSVTGTPWADSRSLLISLWSHQHQSLISTHVQLVHMPIMLSTLDFKKEKFHRDIIMLDLFVILYLSLSNSYGANWLDISDLGNKEWDMGQPWSLPLGTATVWCNIVQSSISIESSWNTVQTLC